MKKLNFVIDNPTLMLEWDSSTNEKEGIYPDKLTCGSKQAVWWICKVDPKHRWSARIVHRRDGHGCPFCSGRRAIPGINDLATLYPDIAAEWDYQRNYPKEPTMAKPMSDDSVSWICEKGHNYLSTISNRIKGNGCPYCANKKVWPGFNDLASQSPELALEWDYNANTILPNQITTGSGTKVHWLCKRNHSYLASPNDRKRGRGCPYCSNKKVLAGFNDLLTVFPEIAAEWDYQKNDGKSPKDYVYGSSARVCWRCKKGHTWSIPIINRTRDGNGCPACNQRKSTSFPEKALLYYVRQSYPSALGNYRSKALKNREIDVYLSEYKIGIEYDGDIWHRDAERDNEKSEQCTKAGIVLIRIREPECPHINDDSINFQMTSHTSAEFSRGVVFALEKIGEITKHMTTSDVSIDRDTQVILKTMEIEEVEKSLASVNPELAKEWHPTKNSISPKQIAANSNFYAWWLGKCGHEWPAYVYSRNAGCGCPICRGLRVKPGFNDLESLHPEIAKEWNYEKNSKLPSEIAAKSGETVWWTCKLGHDYPAKPINRVVKKQGCPYCSHRKLLIGFNDLKSTHPTLADEWDYEKNGEKRPENYMAGSKEKPWWKCRVCGYEWSALICNRSRGSGCPKCSHRIRKPRV